MKWSRKWERQENEVSHTPCATEAFPKLTWVRIGSFHHIHNDILMTELLPFFFNNVIGELFICFILHQNLKGLSVCAISFSFEPPISQAFAHTVLQNLLLSRHKWLPNSHKSRGLLSVLILFDPKPMYDISPFFFVHLNWLQEHNSFKKFIYFNWRLNTVKYWGFFVYMDMNQP